MRTAASASASASASAARRPLATPAAALLALAVVAQGAAAQTATRPGSTNVRGRAFVDGAEICRLNAVATFDRTCLSGVGATAELRADVGPDRRLHAEASMWDSRFQSLDQPSAFAEASYAERLTFTGALVPESVRLTLFLHGSVGGSTHSYGALTLWHSGSEPRVSIGIRGERSSGPPPVSTGPTLPVPSAQWVRRTVDLPVVGGRVDFALALQAHVLLPVRIDDGVVNCPAGFCPVRAARSAFFQTAGVELVQAFDAGGAAITGGLELAAASGATYALAGAAPTSTVPEPSAWALLGAGVAATAAAARRRRPAEAA